MLVSLVFLLASVNICVAVDEIQKDYSNRISDYRIEIITKSGNVKRAAIRGGKGFIVAEKEFNDLEKEINNFKSEMLKYYKGKLPRKLEDKMHELRMFYYKTKQETYESIK